MADHDFEATVETDHGTFTFSGDDPMTVSAQAARMPVVMHSRQVQDRIDLDCPVMEYLRKIAEEEEKLKQKKNSLRPERNRRDC